MLRRREGLSTRLGRACEVCGAWLITSGARARPVADTATCRAHGGQGKVALRRVPTLSRASRNFSEFSVMDGQQLEVLEQDGSGEFFRVRARKAPRYREEGTVAVTEGWIRHIYLEWPTETRSLMAAATPSPRMPPAYASVDTSAEPAAAAAAWAHSSIELSEEEAAPFAMAGIAESISEAEEHAEEESDWDSSVEATPPSTHREELPSIMATTEAAATLAVPLAESPLEITTNESPEIVGQASDSEEEDFGVASIGPEHARDERSEPQ